MTTTIITYQTKTATANNIQLHLTDCSDSFVPALNSRVNIKEYSRKIAINAITFEAWDKKVLIGLIASYFNIEEQFGFITSVSVNKQYMGTGIASKLLKMCLDYSRLLNFKEIKLEVNKDNIAAINFYKKYNFTQTQIKEDSIFMNHIISKQ